MSEAPGDGDREGSPYIRLPWPVAAGGILLFLALMLAVGLYANRNLRPRTAVAATPVVEAVPTTLAPLATPTVRPQSTTLAQQRTSMTATVVAAATPTANLPAELLSTPTTAVVPTPGPTVSPELAAEIGDAYKQYWDVRAQALYDLDTSRLQEVMAGEHLAAAEELIGQLRAEGHAIQTSIDHKYIVVEANSTDATLVDRYVDQSVWVDAQTHFPITSPTGQVFTEQYSFSKLDGTWRVVSLARSP